jgi:hypothetical protein
MNGADSKLCQVTVFGVLTLPGAYPEFFLGGGGRKGSGGAENEAVYNLSLILKIIL